MKVLLIGTGNVGEAIATIALRRDPKSEWLEKMVLADYDAGRLQEVAAKFEDKRRFPAERVDAGKKEGVIALARKYEVDFIMNACDPLLNIPIFDAAYEYGCTYMDMALSLSESHPEDPFHTCFLKLGDLQFAQSDKWKEKGLLALVGSGVEPGMANVFARYAEKYFFDEIEEIGVRDGNNFNIAGYDVAFGFSIWTTIEECLNPPVIWERERGWYTTDPFSDPEIFPLPCGIGGLEMVNVEHEEVLLIPRYIDKGLKKVTFKYGLEKRFIQMLKSLRALHLDRKDEKIHIGGAEISPRELVAMIAPSPRNIKHLIKGKTSAGTWVKGKKGGLERQIYLYQVVDNQVSVQELGMHAVHVQTGFNPVIMMELLAKGTWKNTGVCGPEAFEPEPFIGLMDVYGFPGGVMEIESEYLRAMQCCQFKQPLSFKFI